MSELNGGGWGKIVDNTYNENTWSRFTNKYNNFIYQM